MGCEGDIYFCVGQFFLQVLSQQIFTKPCLTSLVFLSSFLPKAKDSNILDRVLCDIIYTPMNAINILQLEKIHLQTNSFMTFNKL